MGLYDFAKCSLLENMVATSIWLPLWQTGIVLLSILFGQVMGAIIGYQVGGRPLPVITLRAVALAVSVALLLAALSVALVSGLQYVLFLLRMVKDGFYCTYFGAAHALTSDQAAALLIAILGNVVISALFSSRRWPSSPLAEFAGRIAAAASCAVCVISGGLPLVAGITAFHAVLLGLVRRSLR